MTRHFAILNYSVIYLLLFNAWRRQALARARQVMQGSRLMLSVIGAFTLTYWVFFTWLFFTGIRFLQMSVPGLGELLIARMFYILFALIFSMLMMSSGIVGYGSFFRNRETAWLQTLPISHAQLFRWKFVEMVILASWAFIFLSGPLLLAYGMALKLSPLFLFGVFAFYIPFSLLANVLGAAGLLVLVRVWHTRMGKPLIVGLIAIGFLLGAIFFKPIDVNAMREAEMLPLMDLLLKNTRITATPLLPSYWVASSIIGLGENLWTKPIFFFGLTVSYAALAGWLLLRYSGQLFYDNTSCVQDRQLHGRSHRKVGWMSPLFWSGNLLAKAFPWLKVPIRSILVKDWMIFWRDTSQWSQFVIFFGLLGFYFLNIRNFRFRLEERFWVSAVAFLNLSSLGLILSTLTTRFIFPQFSLEGRRLWLVGLAPIRLKDVIWGKFWASAVLTGALTLSLMFFSFSSLRLETGLRWIIGFTVLMMSLGLSGIAVGTGVLFPNFKHPNAAQIVSGFGGTFCLILSLAYVEAVVLIVAVPMHVRFMARMSLEFQFASPVALIYTSILLISLAAAFLPMRLAEKNLERLEI